MKKPKVSVLIPVYNCESFIGECIQSALDQTYSDFEVVVVDNSSSDGTWGICQQYALRDQRVHIFQNSNNIGPVLNWKRCFDEASGEYGKVLFSDDLMFPCYLERTISLLENERVGFVFTVAEIGSQLNQGKDAFVWKKKSGLYCALEFIECSLFGSSTPLSPCAALFRISDLKQNLTCEIASPSFDDFSRHGAGPDLLLYLLTALEYEEVAFLHEKLMFFRSHADSISVSSKALVTDRYLQTRLYFSDRYLSSMNKEFLMLEWIKRIRRDGYMGLKEFSRRYLFEPVNFSLSSLMYAFIKWLKYNYFGKLPR